jgi:hypothetical protein
MKSRLISAALCISIALISTASFADDPPVALKRSPKKGDVVRFRAESEIKTGMGDAKLVGTSKTTVKEIKENGSVVLEEATEGGTITLNGMEITLPLMPPTVVTRDMSGKLLELKKEETTGGSESPEVTQLMASIGTPILQEKAVKAGDAWETEVDNPLAKDKRVKLKTVFVGIEKIDGSDFWKIKQTAEAATDASGGKLIYEGIFWLDPANGQEAKAEVAIKDLPSNYGLLNIKTKATRVKPLVKSGA